MGISLNIRNPMRLQWCRQIRYLWNSLRHSPLFLLTVCCTLGLLGALVLLLMSSDSKSEKVQSGVVELVPLLGEVEEYRYTGVRPDIYPGASARFLHGKIGLDLTTGKNLWSPSKRSNFRMTDEDRTKAHEGYCFNTRVSASLDLDREVPEYNTNRCLKFDYSSMLDLIEKPVADVVIVFHNEDLSVLLRTVHSVLNRGNPKLLGKVILVNDYSNSTTHPWLYKELVSNLRGLPKTYLYHLTVRRGLMMARIVGSSYSDAEIIVYLDSHIECTDRWLEPMVYEIGRHPKRIVTPYIHTIDSDNFNFFSNYIGVVGFTWTLGQSHPNRPTDHFSPMPSPIMAGGLFAANRDWFLEQLGGYDPEMKIYGGEEMEIGIKTWLCGGSIYVLPCSRIGHIFRTDKYWKGQVYYVDFNDIIRNKRRVAEVWLDEYKIITDLTITKLRTNSTLGDLSNPISIKQKLRCKPFKWFLDNVFPELYVPNINSTSKGSLINPNSNTCLDTLQQLQNGIVGIYPCHGESGSQSFFLDQARIRSPTDGFDFCIYVDQDNSLAAKKCSSDIGLWKHNDDETLEYTQSNKTVCLTAVKHQTDFSPYQATLLPCEPKNAAQLWIWSS